VSDIKAIINNPFVISKQLTDRTSDVFLQAVILDSVSGMSIVQQVDLDHRFNGMYTGVADPLSVSGSFPIQFIVYSDAGRTIADENYGTDGGIIDCTTDLNGDMQALKDQMVILSNQVSGVTVAMDSAVSGVQEATAGLILVSGELEVLVGELTSGIYAVENTVENLVILNSVINPGDGLTGEIDNTDSLTGSIGGTEYLTGILVEED
jgi:hypothetical protein